MMPDWSCSRRLPRPRCLAVCLVLASSAGCGAEVPQAVEAGDPQNGRALIVRAGCGSCHRIPGIATARGEVGPPLDHLSRRAYLAGVLPNSHANLARWIARPQSVAPGSAMPDLGLTDAQAQDIAAYLYAPQ